MEILAISLTILAICSIITTILIYDLKKKIVSPCADCKIVKEQCEGIEALCKQLDEKNGEIKRLQVSGIAGFAVALKKVSDVSRDTD